MTTAEELRTLVAKKVMGCELKIAQDDQGYDEEWWVFPANGESCMSEMRLRGQWQPDVTWADAGRVIAKVRADWTYKEQRLFSLLLKHIILMKLVEDEKQVDHNWVVFVDPVDICAAVIEVLGVEVG